MNSPKAKSYPMTPENFGRLRHAISLLQAEPGLRLHKIESRDGKIHFSLVLTEVFGMKIHPRDPAIVLGAGSNPSEAIEEAITRGRALIQAICQPINHPIFQ